MIWGMLKNRRIFNGVIYFPQAGRFAGKWGWGVYTLRGGVVDSLGPISLGESIAYSLCVLLSACKH